VSPKVSPEELEPIPVHERLHDPSELGVSVLLVDGGKKRDPSRRGTHAVLRRGSLMSPDDRWSGRGQNRNQQIDFVAPPVELELGPNQIAVRPVREPLHRRRNEIVDSRWLPLETSTNVPAAGERRLFEP
jgi:hypothetical protein